MDNTSDGRLPFDLPEKKCSITLRERVKNYPERKLPDLRVVYFIRGSGARCKIFWIDLKMTLFLLDLQVCVLNRKWTSMERTQCVRIFIWFGKLLSILLSKLLPFFVSFAVSRFLYLKRHNALFFTGKNEYSISIRVSNVNDGFLEDVCVCFNTFNMYVSHFNLSFILAITPILCMNLVNTTYFRNK